MRRNIIKHPQRTTPHTPLDPSRNTKRRPIGKLRLHRTYHPTGILPQVHHHHLRPRQELLSKWDVGRRGAHLYGEEIIIVFRQRRRFECHVGGDEFARGHDVGRLAGGAEELGGVRMVGGIGLADVGIGAIPRRGGDFCVGESILENGLGPE